MKVLLVFLSLLVFVGRPVSGADTKELEEVDVIAKLKSKAPECQLRQFVETDDEYKAFTADLSKFCAASGQKKQCRILCNMLSCELTKACQLDNSSRPSPVKYSLKMSSKEICSLKKIQMTNQWIWNVISDKGQKQIDVPADKLCETVTSDEEVLPLAKFFYKAAPRVRHADLKKQDTNDATKTDSNKQTLGESAKEAVNAAKNTVVDVAQSIANKTKSLLGTGQEKVEEAGKAVKEEVQDKASKGAEIVKDTKDKLKETGEEGAEDVEKKAKDALGQSKGKIVETAKNKAQTALENASEKGGAAIEAAKDRVRGATGTKQDKDDQADGGPSRTIDSDKDKNNNADGDKTGEDPDDKKGNVQKVVDAAKEKVADAKTGLSKVGEKIGEAVKDGVEKLKEGAEKVVGETDKTAQKTGEEPKELDVKKEKKPAGNDEEEDEDDDTIRNKNKNQGPTDPEQGKQLPKPDLTDKKEDGKEPKKVDTNDPKVKPNEVDGDQDGDKNEEDKQSNEEANQQLRKQQNNADNEDAQAAGTDNKNNKGGSEPEPDDDYDGQNLPADQVPTETPAERNEDAEYEDANRPPSGMKIQKTGSDDKVQKPYVRQPETDRSKSRSRTQVSRNNGEGGWSGGFVTYFLLFTLFVVVGYLVLHNKNKLMAYVVEGRRTSGSRTGSRPSHRGYEKLKNVNDVMLIDDTNPVSDKEAVFLKA